MGELDHYYYLHTNGELIHKPAIVVDSDPQYFDSDFVRRYWKVNLSDRGSGYIMLAEAAALGARMFRVLELADKWNMNGDDAFEFFKRAALICEPVETEAGRGYELYHKEDTPDMKKGAGSTPLLALISYIKAGKFPENAKVMGW